ncbi:zinc finger protein 611 isoform X4 [Aedes aegypti]|uniref:C2H2-type domain-containing protein n=1 Tax=Aedes aegypti TaxID=7159 RepID=A0A6I8TVG9_AEDAE|nr:zinc finger protein 611 isoform X4 [Aedes aegypti]
MFNVKGSVCPHCQKQFGTKVQLRNHVRTIHGLLESVDGKQSQSDSASLPQDDKPQHKSSLECKICATAFKSEAALRQHLNKHANANGPKSYPCTMCDVKFTSREGRRVHMILKHNAGKTYKCEQCPMVFARMGNLRLHMTTHGVRPHVCSICGQSFARIDSLKTHEEACAEGKRGLFCTECGQRFRKQELLEKHLQQGHPDKEFQCNHCGQGFETKRALSHHVRVHEGTFRCEHCPRKFVTEKALRNHEKSRHWDILGIERVIGRQGRRKDAQPRQPKERVRRNKYCPFLGLEHLAELQVKKSESEDDETNDAAFEDGAGSDSEGSSGGRSQTGDANQNLSDNTDETIPMVAEEFQSMEDVPMVIAHNNLESEVKTEETDPNCSSDSEHKVEKDENLHLADADEPTVPNPDDFTSDAESSDVRKDYSDRDMNQTSSSESDRVKSPELRTKRKSRRKPDSTEPKTASPKEPLPKKYKCDDCGKSFAHQPWWAAHRAKAHGIQETVKPNKQNRIHCCDECPKSFCDWRNLVYHLRHIHQKKIDAVQIVSCQLCKRKLLSENELKLHTCSTRRGFQSRPPEFKCDQCGKAYVSRQALESHRSVHEETHTISCDLCEKPFANEKDLSYHKKRVHVDASFVCEVCGKAFKVQNQLKTHTNIHMKSKSYQCEYCGRAFAQRNGMTAHLRIAHAEQLGEQALAEREISCPICFKKLKGKVCYRLHMKTHTNDRMYACSFCEKRFVTNQDKLRHEQTHTKKYKFKCRFCDKGSTRRKLILLHEAKEHNEVSGEAIGPQHKCSICGRCFSSPSAVAIHESLHSDALPVGCELCDRRFKNVKYMKYHLKAHHKLEAAEQKENGAMVSVDDENEAGQQVSKTEKGDGNGLVQGVDQSIS